MHEIPAYWLGPDTFVVESWKLLKFQLSPFLLLRQFATFFATSFTILIYLKDRFDMAEHPYVISGCATNF